MPDCPVVGSGSLASGITSDVIGFRPVRNLRVHLVWGQSATHSATVRGRFVSREIVPNVYVGLILSGYNTPIVQPDASIDAVIVGVGGGIVLRQVGLHVVGVIVAGVGVATSDIGGVPRQVNRPTVAVAVTPAVIVIFNDDNHRRVNQRGTHQTTGTGHLPA